MSFLSEQVKNVSYLPHYRPARQALETLGHARVDLLFGSEQEQASLMRVFLDKKEKAREALLKIKDLSPASVGWENYDNHWLYDMTEITRSLARRLKMGDGNSKRGIGSSMYHGRGLSLTAMVAEDYVPPSWADAWKDTALLAAKERGSYDCILTVDESRDRSSLAWAKFDDVKETIKSENKITTRMAQ